MEESNDPISLKNLQGKKPRIVVIGAGFAGVNFLKNMKDQPYEIVLLDRNNYHQFVPFLYQVSTCGIESDAIAFPLRKYLGKFKNVEFKMAYVEHIDPHLQRVYTEIGYVDYDHLVIATGSQTKFLGKDKIKDNALKLRTLEDAIEIRQHVLSALEKASVLSEKADIKRYMTFVIVGGGPTGIELAGTLAEFKYHIIPKDFPEYDANLMDIYLLEAADELLPAMSDAASKSTYDQLTKLGVEVRFNTMVEDYSNEMVIVKDQEPIAAHTFIWAAGVEGYVPNGMPSESINKENRCSVDEYCAIKSLENVYAIGDAGAIESKQRPEGFPMMAPIAIQQGEYLAAFFNAQAKGQKIGPFEYKDRGVMATIGRNKAVADIKGKTLKGWLAWITWVLIHIYFLIGLRNKIIVFLGWVANYLSYDRSNRLIIRKKDGKPIGQS